MKQKHLLRPSTWLKSLLLMVVMAISGSAYADKVVEFDFNNGDAFGVAKDGVTFSGDWQSYSGLGVYVSGGSSFTVTSNTAIKSIEIDNSSYNWGAYYAGNWTVDGGGTAVASNNNKHLTLTPNTPSTIVKASFTGSGVNICTATVTIEEEVIPEEPIPYKVNISGMPDTGASVTLNGEKTYTANGNYNDYEVAKNLNLSSLNVTTPEGYEVTTDYDATSHTFTVTFSKKEYIEFVTTGLTNGNSQPYSTSKDGVSLSGTVHTQMLDLYNNWPITVSSANNIVKVVFTTSNNQIYATASTGTMNNSQLTWTGSANTVVFSTSGDYYVTNIKVYLEAVEPIEYTVNIVSAPEGATVTLDGKTMNSGDTYEVAKKLTTNDLIATETADYYADKSYDASTHTFTVTYKEYLKYAVAVTGTDDANAGVVYHDVTYHVGDNVPAKGTLTTDDVTAAEVAGLEGTVTLNDKIFTVTYKKPEYISFTPGYNETKNGVTYARTANGCNSNNNANIYSSGYGKITLTSESLNIVKVEMVAERESYTTAADGTLGATIYEMNSVGTMTPNGNNATWTGSAKSLTFSSTNDIDINTVKVYLEAVEPIEYTVNIVGAPEGTTVMLDGEAIENGGKRTIEKNLTTNDLIATETDDYYADKSYDASTHTFTVTYKEYLKYAVAVTGTDDANAGVVYHDVTYHVGDNVPAKTELISTDVTAAEVAGLEGTVTLNDKTFTVTYKKPEYIEFITTSSGDGYNPSKGGVSISSMAQYSGHIELWNNSYGTVTVSSTTGNIIKIELTEQQHWSAQPVTTNVGTVENEGYFSNNVLTWTGSANSVTFTTNGDYLISKIRVYLETVEPIEYTVNIVGAPEGATVMLDGEAIADGGKRTIEKNLTAEAITYTAPAGYGATTQYDAASHTFTVTFAAIEEYTYNFNSSSIPFTRGGTALTLGNGANPQVGDIFTAVGGGTFTFTAVNSSWNNSSNGNRLKLGSGTAFTLAAPEGFLITDITFNTDANSLNGLTSASGLTHDSNTQATWAGSAASVDFSITADSWIQTINVKIVPNNPTEYTFQFEGAPEGATVTIGDKTYDKDATYTAMGTLTSIEVTNEDYNTTATIEEGNVIKVVFSRNAYTFQFEGADNTVIANTTLTIDGTEWDAANTYDTKKTLTPNDIEATHADYNTTVTIEEGNVIKVVFSRNAYTVKFEGDFPEDATITIGGAEYANNSTYYTKNTITKDDIEATYDSYETEVAVSELVNNQATITVTYLKESTMSKTFTIAEISKSGSKYWTTFCYDRDFTLPEGYTACIVNTAAENGALTIEELKGEKTEGGSDTYSSGNSSVYTITPQDNQMGEHTYTHVSGNTIITASNSSPSGFSLGQNCNLTCATTTGANITKIVVSYYDSGFDYFSDTYTPNAPTYELTFNGAYFDEVVITYEGANAQPVIPANEGILISAANYTTAPVEITPVKNATPVETTGNLLKGCTTANAGTWNEAGKKYYKFTVNSDGEVGSAGFYWAVDGGVSITAKAGKAYLVLTADQAEKVRGFRLDGTTEGTTDGIDSINGMSDTTPVYNLNGQRMGDKLPAGVYVKGGKKFIVK